MNEGQDRRTVLLQYTLAAGLLILQHVLASESARIQMRAWWAAVRRDLEELRRGGLARLVVDPAPVLAEAERITREAGARGPEFGPQRPVQPRTSTDGGVGPGA